MQRLVIRVIFLIYDIKIVTFVIDEPNCNLHSKWYVVDCSAWTWKRYVSSYVKRDRYGLSKTWSTHHWYRKISKWFAEAKRNQLINQSREQWTTQSGDNHHFKCRRNFLFPSARVKRFEVRNCRWILKGLSTN